MIRICEIHIGIVFKNLFNVNTFLTFPNADNTCDAPPE